MSYISYEYNGQRHVGEIHGANVVPLDGLTEIGHTTTPDVLAEARRDESQAVPTDQVTALPVVPNPSKILCVGLNYRDHVTETKRELPTYPVLFNKYASNLIADHDNIVLPPESTQVDFEGELAVVIGRRGRRISEANAGDFILGFTVANDITMRDFQYKTHQWNQGKAWDSSTPLGPRLVTPSEVDIDHAGIRTVLNGQKVQESDLSMLIFAIPNLIATISTFTVLNPGDVILTGTPGGVGFRREPKLLLKDGDVITVEVDGVGLLENTVRNEAV